MAVRLCVVAMPSLCICVRMRCAETMAVTTSLCALSAARPSSGCLWLRNTAHFALSCWLSIVYNRDTLHEVLYDSPLALEAGQSFALQLSVESRVLQ